MKALVVDDARAMRRILRGMLEKLGFEVTEAVHGLDGLEKYEASPDFHLALVDWNMPEMNGLEFIKAVRARETDGHLTMVMVTTETEPHQMARALMSGADEFVMKPFTEDILLDKLRLVGAIAPADAM